jgi:hypothetical protein
LLAKSDSGLPLYNFVEVFSGVRTARLDNFPRFPFAFALGKKAGTRDRADALSNMHPPFLTGNVFPESYDKPSS